MPKIAFIFMGYYFHSVFSWPLYFGCTYATAVFGNEGPAFTLLYGRTCTFVQKLDHVYIIYSFFCRLSILYFIN